MNVLVCHIGIIMFWLTITACSAEIGSEKWCLELKEKPKGEWTINELGDYSRHCLFK